MIISINTKMMSGKIQYTFRIKLIERIGLEVTNLNTLEAIYNKFIAKITLNRE